MGWRKNRTFYGIISNQTNILAVGDDQPVLSIPNLDMNHSRSSRLPRNRIIAKEIVEGKNLNDYDQSFAKRSTYTTA